jgi:hypothetical protein
MDMIESLLLNIFNTQQVHGKLLKDILAAVAPQGNKDEASPLEMALRAIFQAIEKNTEVLLKLETHLNKENTHA